LVTFSAQIPFCLRAGFFGVFDRTRGLFAPWIILSAETGAALGKKSPLSRFGVGFSALPAGRGGG
jgi:hypothetical protein